VELVIAPSTCDAFYGWRANGAPDAAERLRDAVAPTAAALRGLNER
jgi:hypothetical protein